MIQRRLTTAVFVALACLANAVFAQDVHEALKHGAPDTGHIVDYGTYIMSYDGRLRSARWVAEKLTKESLVKTVDRKNDFRPDAPMKSVMSPSAWFVIQPREIQDN